MKSLILLPIIFFGLMTCGCDILNTNSVCIEGASATYEVTNYSVNGIYYVISKITDQKNTVTVYDAMGNIYTARIQGMSGSVQQNINSQVGDMSDWIENAHEAGYTTVKPMQNVSNGTSSGVVAVMVNTGGMNQCGDLIITGTAYDDWMYPFYVPN